MAPTPEIQHGSASAGINTPGAGSDASPPIVSQKAHDDTSNILSRHAFELGQGQAAPQSDSARIGGSPDHTLCHPTDENNWDTKTIWWDYRDLYTRSHRAATTEERDNAEKTFDNHISTLLPKADQDRLHRMGHAILDANPEELARTLQEMKDQPDRIKAFVKELNRDLKELGVELAVSQDGNILLYDKKEPKAIEINPVKGTLGERDIMVDTDGSVRLLPGEILNPDTDALAKRIADNAERVLDLSDLSIYPSWNPDRTLPGRHIDPSWYLDSTQQRSPLIPSSNQDQPEHDHDHPKSVYDPNWWYREQNPNDLRILSPMSDRKDHAGVQTLDLKPLDQRWDL